MSESEILAYIGSSADFRNVLITISEEPKTASKIALDLGLGPHKVASTLNVLENCRAVAYDSGKWKSTDLALKVLQKYFG